MMRPTRKDFENVLVNLSPHVAETTGECAITSILTTGSETAKESTQRNRLSAPTSFALRWLMVLLLKHKRMRARADKLLVCVPGMGGPSHLLEKMSSLERNLAVVHAQIQADWFIRFYDTEGWELYLSVYKRKWEAAYPNASIFAFFRPGQLAEFLRDDFHRIPLSDGVLFLLDDVELLRPFSIEVLVSTLKAFDLHVVSPLMSSDSHAHCFMKRVPQAPASRRNYMTRLVNFVEFFCVYFSKEGWEKYRQLIPPDNQYLWGIDLLMYPYGELKMGMVDVMFVKHHFSAKSGRSHQIKNMTEELKRITQSHPRHLAFRWKTLEWLNEDDVR